MPPVQQGTGQGAWPRGACARASCVNAFPKLWCSRQSSLPTPQIKHPQKLRFPSTETDCDEQEPEKQRKRNPGAGGMGEVPSCDSLACPGYSWVPGGGSARAVTPRERMSSRQCAGTDIRGFLIQLVVQPWGLQPALEQSAQNLLPVTPAHLVLPSSCCPRVLIPLRRACSPLAGIIPVCLRLVLALVRLVYFR